MSLELLKNLISYTFKTNNSHNCRFSYKFNTKNLSYSGVSASGKMRGSNWDEVLDQLTESLKSQLPKINRDAIIKFCVENKTTRNAAEDFLKKFQKTNQKCSESASRKKEEGNEKYNKKKYEDSLLLYTESIFQASKDDECLPLAYSNRALVLQQMGFLPESIQDIDMALSAGYPKSKSQKLILRKTRGLVQLGEIEKAKEVLTESLKNCDEEEFHQQVKKELEKLKNYKNKTNITSNSNLPKPAGGENENFASASNYLSVNYDNTRGRHVVATHGIEIGDILFVEKPFACVLFKEGCQNCLKKTKAPIPCWNCLDVAYCSAECRKEFWKSVHSFECGFAELFKSVGIAHLSLRIVLNASSSLDELRKILENISEPQYKNGTVQYKEKSYDCVYNLVHNYEKYETNDLFQYVMTSLLLGLYMKNHTDYFGGDVREENLEFLVLIILRHILQLICNGHAITEFKELLGVEVAKKEEVRCGTSIYPSASMMNHSCEPSIINSFQGKWLIVRAIKPIKKGEEVFNCYGPNARRMKRSSRQEVLNKQYFFQCNCQACLQEFDIQDVLTAFKCTNCKGPSVPNSETSQSTVCLSCGLTSKISKELINKQNKFYSLINEGEEPVDDDVGTSLKYFLESWRLGREIFYKFHKDLGFAAEEVARCLATLGDFRRCILFLKCCIRSIEVRFGSFTIELADEMKKLGDAITCCIVDCEEKEKKNLAREGVQYYQKAHSIIKLLFGAEFKELKEIEMSKRILEGIINRN